MRLLFACLMVGTCLGLALPLGANRSAAAGLCAPNPEQEETNNCLAFVVNRSNPLDNVSLAELRKIFLAERNHWPDGHRITIVMQDPGQPERKAVLKQIYRMNENDFSRYFLHKAFTGEVPSSPKTLASSTGVRKFVFNVPGAIGYVRASEVDATVKAIRVDGRLPGEKGYGMQLEAR